MPLELLTLKDLEKFKTELLLELKTLFLKQDEYKKLLKTREVCKLLRVSPGTLQNLRRNGTLSFSKVGGIIYYHYDDVNMLLRKRRGNQNGN